jgi:hypothetical protein
MAPNPQNKVSRFLLAAAKGPRNLTQLYVRKSVFFVFFGVSDSVFFRVIYLNKYHLNHNVSMVSSAKLMFQ